MNRISEKEFLSASQAMSQELRNQLALLIETPVGTVVLDRDFGVDYACVDNPPVIAQSMLAGQLAEKIDRYIPGLRLVEVRLQQINTNGNLNMKVVVDIAESL